MSYDAFREIVRNEFKQYLPPVYQEWELEIREVPKVNGYMDGISLIPTESGEGTPTIYVQDLYQYYLQCGDMEQVFRKAASVFVVGMEYASTMNDRGLMEMPKDRIVFCLINAEENQRLLENVPHRKTLDLALIYRVLLYSEDGGFDSAIITNELAEAMHLMEEELYQLAMKNTPELLPAKVHYCDGHFAILTNQYKILGATALLYPGLLSDVAESLDSDLYIMPSSIHEVFLVPPIGQSVAEMNRMTVEANNTVVPPEEVLAHHVYYYDREKDKVEIPEATSSLWNGAPWA